MVFLHSPLFSQRNCIPGDLPMIKYYELAHFKKILTWIIPSECNYMTITIKSESLDEICRNRSLEVKKNAPKVIVIYIYWHTVYFEFENTLGKTALFKLWSWTVSSGQVHKNESLWICQLWSLAKFHPTQRCFANEAIIITNNTKKTWGRDRMYVRAH